MSWKKKDEFIDTRTGMHVTTLHEPDGGAEAKVQIVIGHDECHHCGHAIPKTNLDELDPKAHVQNEIALRNTSHDKMLAYAAKHRIPVRKATR